MFNSCETRKYAALKGNIAYVFRVGSNTGVRNDVCKKPSKIVSNT